MNKGIRRAFRSEEEAILEAVESAENSDHPGYPHETAMAMIKAYTDEDPRQYPHRRLLKVDRFHEDGSLLHPYAVKRQGEDWNVLIYRPYVRGFVQMAERDFIRLPMAPEMGTRR